MRDHDLLEHFVMVMENSLGYKDKLTFFEITCVQAGCVY